MMIAEGYLLIGDISFLERNSSMIQHLLQSVIGKVAPIGEAYVSLVIESLLRKFPLEGGLLLLKGGILKDLLKFCSQNFFKVDSCEPDRVIILYLTTLARVLLYAPQFSDEILHACQQDGEAQFGYEELVRALFKIFTFCFRFNCPTCFSYFINTCRFNSILGCSNMLDHTAQASFNKRSGLFFFCLCCHQILPQIFFKNNFS